MHRSTLSTFQFPLDLDGHLNTCLDNFPPYAVRFEHEQFLVMDDSLINPLRKGVDHFIVTDQGCPGAPEDGSTIVPIRENRYLDPKTKNETDKQVAIFTNWFKRIEELSQGRENNFYVGHRPILGSAGPFTGLPVLFIIITSAKYYVSQERVSVIKVHPPGSMVGWILVLQARPPPLC